MSLLLSVVATLLLVVQLVLLARVVLDWSEVFAGPAVHGSARWRAIAALHAVTEPVLAPIRRVVPPLRLGAIALDVAFVIVFFGVVALRQVVLSL
jgi:YggT family protein